MGAKRQPRAHGVKKGYNIHMVETLIRYRFKVEEYHQMYNAGILDEDSRTELIRGEIVQMTPIGSRHAAAVNRINRILNERVSQQAIVSVQNPVQLDDENEPQPDIALLRPRTDFYEGSHPKAKDVLLIMEVCDTSADNDRSIKIPLYAKSGIPQVWLILLSEKTIESFRLPVEGKYAETQRYSANDVVLISELPAQIELGVMDLLGNA